MNTLHLALTVTQAYAQSWLNDGDKVPYWYLDEWEWNELQSLMELQFEGDFVFAAVLDAGYIASGEHTHDSLADDLYFEMTHEGMKR